MSEDENRRVEGVDFSDIEPLFEDVSYPISAEEIVDDYGDRELDRTNADPISVSELFSYMGDTTFESEDELEQMILGQMPRGSEGRTNYSDRGGSLPVETEEAEEAEEQTTADIQDGESTDPDTRGDDSPGTDEDPEETDVDETKDTM